MTARYAFPPEWTAAIREDAASSQGGVARQRAGLLRKISQPTRVRLRVGRQYPQPFKTDRLRDPTGPRAEYLPHPPICQACGHRIPHNDLAIVFKFHKTKASYVGRIRYIHAVECPKENE